MPTYLTLCISCCHQYLLVLLRAGRLTRLLETTYTFIKALA